MSALFPSSWDRPTPVRERNGENYGRPLLTYAAFAALPADILRGYIDFTALAMAKACEEDPDNASAKVWFGYEHWNELVSGL